MAKKKTTAEAHAPKATKGTPSTQKYIEISEFRNDTVIMKDGTLRAVLLVSSLNFFLKSDDEQQGIVQAYMQLLNTFDFPLQVVVQSRAFDISKYLERLEKIEQTQENDLLRIQIADYRQFISELVQIGQIMDKRFYVVIPYDPVADTGRGFFKQLGALFSASAEISLKREQFLRRKHFLDQRADNVSGALTGMGLNAVRVDTQSLMEIFYNLYNPETSPQQKLAETDKLSLET
ncbi:MAG: TraC family protein [Patescibacteria group bacterium]